MPVSRRAFIESVLAAGLGASLPENSFSRSLEQGEKASRVINRSDVRLGSGVELTQSQWELLLDTLNGLSKRYPGVLDNLAYVEIRYDDPDAPSKEGGAGPLARDKTKSSLSLGSKLFESPECFRQVCTHEFGHLLYIYSREKGKLNEEQFAKLYYAMESLEMKNQSRILKWFSSDLYISESEKSKIGYVGYRGVGNQVHLFTDAFACLELYPQQFKKKIAQANDNELRLIRQAMDQVSKAMLVK